MILRRIFDIGGFRTRTLVISWICIFCYLTDVLSTEDSIFGSFRNTDDKHSHHTSAFKLRHVRHPRPHPQPQDFYDYDPPTNEVSERITTTTYSSSSRQAMEENHKPVFVNCSNYKPVIKEEESVGTKVFQVQAVDQDPPENGGNITYTLVRAPREKDKFQIDPITGVVSTLSMLDRDEPEREKEVYITVGATDNGHPSLSAVCTIKIRVEDINDNAPQFDKVSYVESVPQDLQVGNEVMRISATDIDDGSNSMLSYSLRALNPEDQEYFKIDKSTGIIYLERPIDRAPKSSFLMEARATDHGEDPKESSINLTIQVIESHKKAPVFTSVTESPIFIPENLTDHSYNIATLVAESNTDEKAPIFTLVEGRTEQTNAGTTFQLVSEGNTAHIRLGHLLDYESITEYTLTVRIVNKYNLHAEKQIQINVLDVNDNTPVFRHITSGSVPENEPPGSPVMTVQAYDADSTSDNNQITYELADNTENFAIDKYTGKITTLKTFDREEQDFYNVKVIASDNSPSANQGLGFGKPNKGQQVFKIEITDKNDHSPKFTQATYVAENIAENVNINAPVTEVKALDNDTASPVQYSIVSGNTNNAFEIESRTGKIRVLGELDYEKITNYTLGVRAFDGAYEDFCTVIIKITNVNDNPPVFEPYDKKKTIREEEPYDGCIAKFEAFDPDIPDRDAPQHIVYFVANNKEHFSIDKDGCLMLTKPLDRDPPEGSETWQVLVGANDEDGNAATSQKNSTFLMITLEDINDNAPYLSNNGPVVWRENQPPGTIVTLTAKDNDGPGNGEPFTFSISRDASDDIVTKFSVSGNQLLARTTFDREEKKSYEIPISITDSGAIQMTGTSYLTVIIGDQNDNPMRPGESSIFVYNYKGESPDTEIGRVYVEDEDDWDLPDKVFKWSDGAHPSFDLNHANGMITMLEGTQQGSYQLHFKVTEQSPMIPHHSVEAWVNVTVQEIPEEAVDKSGSFRLDDITAEEFVEPNEKGISKATILKNRLAKILNTSVENVDVFTVLHSPHNMKQNQLDVRFSAHGSPYYAPERINMAIASHQGQIEQELGAHILMINIDECLLEKNNCNDSLSCINFLNKSNAPYAVYTNKTSFVGVRAVVDPFCRCEVLSVARTCHNGGTPVGDTCACLDKFTGPRCERVSIGFNGDGWALYPTLQSCHESTLSFELRAYKPEGLVFYVGPISYRATLGVRDFMSLELRNGFPVLLVDYGSGTVKIEQHQIRLDDGEPHRIDIIFNNISIELQVDKCKLGGCLTLATPVGSNILLNVNGPLQLGGTYLDLKTLSQNMNWTHRPQNIPFAGCISNMTFNEKMYNLGFPSLGHNTDDGCNNIEAGAVTFGFNANFLIAILICCALLLILLLAVIVQRKKTDDAYKDTDDIRENIINYEDEGGGEGDQTAFDLEVLRFPYNTNNGDTKMPNGGLIRDEVPDICGFLDGKKSTVDNDPETNPFDDVRHYAYEGDGNTTGSLSSLASVTDEGDLNFDYLSNFGPRFRKLADMYGEDPSDEEEEHYQPAASESWC